jgi:DNA-binding IclR family transcriptional regulator
MQRRKTKVASHYQAPALEKGLDILELFAREPGGLTKSDVARRLGRTVSEVFRMLVCLEERGYISESRVEGERFHLTLRLFELGQQYPPTKRLIIESLPIMQQVTHELNQSCHLGVLDGDRVVIVAQVDSPLSVGFYVKAGGIGDLMRSATGHVILAHQSPEVVSRAVQLWCQHNQARPRRDFGVHLTKIQRRGYEQRKSYEVEGVVNISFPVLDDRGYAVAALSVPFLQRIGSPRTPVTVIRVLGEASSLLSERIGGRLNERNALDRGPHRK